jgi:hypothetical protein
MIMAFSSDNLPFPAVYGMMFGTITTARSLSWKNSMSEIPF